MIITVLLLLVFLGIFIVPKKRLNVYFLFGSLLISLHALFFIPPIEFDLARHLEQLELLRYVSLSEVHKNGELFEYYYSSRIYFYIAFIFSKIPIYNGITVLVTFVTFFLFSIRILTVGNELRIEKWKLALCFLFVITALDFRSIYGIRNMMAYAMLAFVLYEDLVNGKNKLISGVLYVLIAGIHTAVVPIVALRYLLLLEKFFSFKIIAFVVLVSYSFTAGIASVLADFTSIPLLSVLSQKITRYSLSGTEYNLTFALFRGLSMASYGLLVWFLSSNGMMDNRFTNYRKLFTLILCFTFSAASQYDLFIRNEILLIFMSIPFVLQFYKNFLGYNFLTVKNFRGKRYLSIGVAVYIFHLFILFTSFIYYISYTYLGLDKFFK